MKILYIHNSPFDSELANLHQVKSMCKAMAEMGFEVLLSLMDTKQPKSTIIGDYSNHYIHIRKEHFKSKLSKYFQSKSIKDIATNFKPDLLYIRSPLLLFQARKLGIPIIYELHNNQLHQGSKMLDNYWRRVLVKASINNQLLKIVCISQALSDYWIQQGVPSNKIITAHDGIDQHQFSENVNQWDARKSLNLMTGKKLVTYLGRLYKNRKIERIFLAAMQYPDVTFLIVGGPEEEVRRLNVILTQMNIKNVELTGQVPHEQIANYLFASDVLLAIWSSEVSTINYCSPLKLFEYMGAGKIIVAHGFPTIMEVLENGHNSIICEPDSTTDLINKIGIAIKMEYPNKLAENARNDAFHKYTWQKRVQNIFHGI